VAIKNTVIGGEVQQAALDPLGLIPGTVMDAKKNTVGQYLKQDTKAGFTVTANISNLNQRRNKEK